MESRGQRLEELFHRAVDLDPSDRSAFLGRECPSDPELREQLERLFAENDLGTRSFLQRELGADAGVDGRIGGYRILRPLGAGGMGAVWLALQDEPVQRRVALKTIRSDRGSAEVAARFEAEREALERMDHPGIARVFDAGVTPVGTPWFAMEYVPGRPITEFCDHFRLDLPARLALFRDVCDAVQHAHHKGIIHRDLKPGNVLVAERDGRPAAKIIDFGIARAIGGSLLRDPLHDTMDGVVGTGLYMSPEQADPRGIDIDTRTDVYSLGVILYELLAGAHPYDLEKGEIGGLLGLQRALRDLDPPLASRRVAGLARDEALRIARDRRFGKPEALERRLRGDLDWILVRALEKERERRYATPLELAEDLRRHEANEPVRAGPPGAFYLLSKFVRRNRTPVVLGSLLFAALVGVVAMTAVGLVRTRSARSAEEQQRRAAERRSEELRARSEFMEWSFLTLSPDDANPPTFRDVLDHGTEWIPELFEGRLFAEAAVRYQAGRAYLLMGDERAALDQLLRAWALQKRDPQVSDLRRFWTLKDLIHAERVVRGPDAVDEHVAACLELGLRYVAEHQPDLSGPLEDVVALVRGERPDGAVALERLRTVVGRIVALHHEDDSARVALRVVAEVGLRLRHLWGLPEARLFLQELEEPASDLLPKVSIEALLHAWAQVVTRLTPESDPEEFAELLERALVLRERAAALPAGHWLRAESERLVGLSLAGQGNYDEAETALLAAWAHAARLADDDISRARETQGGLRELIEQLELRGELEGFLDESLARWRAQGFEAGPCPWWVVDHRLGSAVAGEAALARIEAAVAEDPADGALAILFGIAQHRAGRHEDAVRALIAAEGRDDAGEPARLAYLALAAKAVGRSDLAAESRGRLEVLRTRACDSCGFRRVWR